MKRLQFLLPAVLVLTLSLGAQTAPAAPQLPDTPAGRQFQAWLTAFNSGDRAALQKDLDANFPPDPARLDRQMQLRQTSGGFELRKVESSTPTKLVCVIQHRASGNFQRLSFQVEAEPPYRALPRIVFANIDAPPDLAAAPGPQVADSPAEKLFRAWLVAFNGGHREEILAFYTAHFPTRVESVNGMMAFRQATGGFDFRRTESATATAYTALVQEHDSDQFARATVELEPGAPEHIRNMGLRGIPRPAEFAIPRMSEADLVKALHVKLDALAAQDNFSGAALVAHNGKPVFTAFYGMADRENKVANKLTTRFRMGSMNKMFTATSIIQLVQAGKIKLDDPLGKYLPDYPNKDVASKVTIHHLLTHTGGTGDFFGPEFTAHRLELKTLQDYVKMFGARPLRFEPGARYEYSNYGFLLLGLVVEKASGQDYYDYVRDHIFKPAGMTGSGSEPENVEVPDRSKGYMNSPAGKKLNTDTLPYRGTSAGGGYTTVEDLMRFATALTSHKLLDAEHTDLLTTGKVNAGPGSKYAYGFDDSVEGGVRSFGHSGGAPGMNGDLRIFPESGYVIAVLVNMDQAASCTSQWISARLPAK